MINQDIENIIQEQGWNETTLHFLMENFIKEKKLTKEFLSYIKNIQKEENNFQLL